MDLSELVIEAGKRDEESEFLALMREHHYLGAPHKIGESAFYAAIMVVCALQDLDNRPIDRCLPDLLLGDS